MLFWHGSHRAAHRCSVTGNQCPLLASPDNRHACTLMHRLYIQVKQSYTESNELNLYFNLAEASLVIGWNAPFLQKKEQGMLATGPHAHAAATQEAKRHWLEPSGAPEASQEPRVITPHYWFVGLQLSLGCGGKKSRSVQIAAGQIAASQAKCPHRERERETAVEMKGSTEIYHKEIGIKSRKICWRYSMRR